MPMFDADVNVQGTINVLDACVAHNVSKIVFASSAGAVYGNPAGALPISEDYIPCPLSPYGVSKLCAEHYIILYSILHGIQYTTLRYANVFGPRQSPGGEAGVCAILADQMLRNQQVVLYGFGDPHRDYIYVDDIVSGTIASLEKGEGETLNLSTGKGTSVYAIFNWLKDITGYDLDPFLKPLRSGEVNNIYTSFNRAHRMLEWYPVVDIQEGLSRTVQYVQDLALD